MIQNFLSFLGLEFSKVDIANPSHNLFMRNVQVVVEMKEKYVRVIISFLCVEVVVSRILEIKII